MRDINWRYTEICGKRNFHAGVDGEVRSLNEDRLPSGIIDLQSDDWEDL